MNIRLVGDCALLVELSDFNAAQALRHHLCRLSWPGIVEIVPGYRSVLIEVDPLVQDPEETAATLQGLVTDAMLRPEPIEHQIDVRYEGADLVAVAKETGLTVAEVIRRHSGAIYTVAFLGFAPGFPYLVGLDPALQVARLKAPRAGVPAGSVAIADQFSGIYPRSTPGGWRLLGVTDAILFDATRPRPALLNPGDRVRFRALQ